jgi:NADH-quinone oxidoreductase subunit I
MARGKGGVVVVQRPTPTLMDRLFIPAILKGLVITLGHLYRTMFFESRFDLDSDGAITQQYPEVPTRTAENYRGAPVLVKNPEGKVKCVSCQLCEFICPPRAISIHPAEQTDEVRGQYTNDEKYPEQFSIDMLRCIYCGFCEEVCPEQAIFLSQEYSLVATRREELIFDKERLLEMGGVRLDMIQKWENKAAGRDQEGRSR